ncbi:MAG: hypothetical protein GVY13_18230 [Alphaproteobacteria bacterium]|jgi:hypothetical protein|nr:hypothetical protein [Alphaproteobacteria bacterium]
MEQEFISLIVREDASTVLFPIDEEFTSGSVDLQLAASDMNEDFNDIAQGAFVRVTIGNLQVFPPGYSIAAGNPVIDDDIIEDEEIVFVEATGQINEMSLNRIFEITIIDDDSDVLRFFNTQTRVHFYSANQDEIDNVRDSNNFEEEGVSFKALNPNTENAEEVYRFFNTETKVHFYTISEDERERVQETLPQFEFEGVAYYAYDEPEEGSMPLYRFFNTETNAHFYTPSESERATVQETLSEFTFEGIAFYVDSLIG